MVLRAIWRSKISAATSSGCPANTLALHFPHLASMARRDGGRRLIVPHRLHTTRFSVICSAFVAHRTTTRYLQWRLAHAKYLYVTGHGAFAHSIRPAEPMSSPDIRHNIRPCIPDLGDSDLRLRLSAEVPDGSSPAAFTQFVIRSNSSRIALKTASRAEVSAGLLGTVVRRDTNVCIQVWAGG